MLAGKETIKLGESIMLTYTAYAAPSAPNSR
jgi:hypothetical protein